MAKSCAEVVAGEFVGKLPTFSPDLYTLGLPFFRHVRRLVAEIRPSSGCSVRWDASMCRLLGDIRYTTA